MKKISFIEDEYMTLDRNMEVPANPSPRKMATATATLEKVVLAQEKKRAKSWESSLILTPLQKELLNFYVHEPNEKQMQELKDFMLRLFEESAIREEEVVTA